ncbi:MAG: Na/Pi cotransporter family protein [Firmicutes bacterium]|nr:Na/Pi cotransporter family protein [Bacillota bacterium]
MNALTALVGLAGGLGLFVYGMQMCSEGLQKMAAHRLKHLVKALTSNRVFGLLVGAVVTFGLQGSSAASALVVGLVSAEMMTLSQALGFLLGSAIGGSLTVQLIAFQITDLALALLFVGAILYLFSRRSRQKSLGQAILGFGLIFYGMFVMSSSMVPVRNYPVVAQTLVSLERYPVLEFLVALIVTAIIQSSPAFLALLMTLGGQGLIGPYAIIPFVLGAHLGGTVTGVISSLGAPGRGAKRAAIANLAFKFVNGLVFLPFYRPLTRLVLLSSPNLSREIANTHTFFSLVMAIGFLPFIPRVAELMMRLMPDKHPRLGEARFLDESLLEVPELAVDQSHLQTVEMGRIVQEEMLDRVIPALRYGGNDEVIDRLTEAEQAADQLYKKISQYVTSLGSNRLSDELMHKSIQVLYVAHDLEHIGDTLMSVLQITRKIRSEELEFSQEGLEEIEAMYSPVHDNFSLALKAFETSDQALASRVIKEHPKILRLEKELRYSHFDRMQSGNEKTARTSSVHLDLIEAMLRIDSHAVNIAQVVLGIV